MQLINLTIGIVLTILGLTELIPAFVEFIYGNYYNAEVFFFSFICSSFFGGSLVLSNRGCDKKLNLHHAFMLTSLIWLIISLFAAFPFYLSDLGISFTDALFESVSGITTTGSTVITGLDTKSEGVLVWRSMIQWIGGIGIIGFAIVFLPFLRVGGMQLFQTESSDRSEKIMPKTGTVVTYILVIYCFITVICAVVYNFLGMNLFDSINHALTTIPTGGFSTHDASIGYFQNPALELAATIFMFLSGIPFVLYIKLFFQGKFGFFQDEQFRAMIIMVLMLILSIGIWAWRSTDYSFAESIRYSAFHVVSIITTTGYASTDYTLWGSFALITFFFITYIGASAGSTAGGLKTMRVIIAFKVIDKQIIHLLSPHRATASKYQGKPLDQSTISKVMGFISLYITFNALLTLALTVSGLDFTTAISGAATAIANVGPGVGSIIGPAGNFATLPDISKWLLCAGMLLGRLEILTVIVLFTRGYWSW